MYSYNQFWPTIPNSFTNEFLGIFFESTLNSRPKHLEVEIDVTCNDIPSFCRLYFEMCPIAPEG